MSGSKCTLLMHTCLIGMQVSRLQRELERMEAERDRAREDARRCGFSLSCLGKLQSIRHLADLTASC